MTEKLQHFYIDEQKLLDKELKSFTESYPEIADSLQANSSKDHELPLQHLIQSFSTISSRIKAEFQQSQDNLIKSILKVLCPHSEYPLPSFSIIQFKARQQLTNSVIVPRKTSLILKNDHNNHAEFNSCYETEVHNIEILSINTLKIDKYSTISLHIHTYTEISPQTAIKFYINQSLDNALLIQNLLFSKLESIKLEMNGFSYEIDRNSLRQVGFSDNEALLEHPDHILRLHRILLEYFNYIEKFLFFEIKTPPITINGKQNFSLEFKVNFLHEDLNFLIDKNTFKLNCCPIINLYPQYAEPIKVHQYKNDYVLLINQGNSTEKLIYKIEEVYGINEQGDKTDYFPMLYNSFKEHDKVLNYWQLNRYLDKSQICYALKIEENEKNSSKFISCRFLACNLDLSKLQDSQKINILFKEIQYTGIEKASAILGPSPCVPAPMKNTPNLIELLNLHYLLGNKEINLNSLQNLLNLYNLDRHPLLSKLNKSIQKLKIEHEWLPNEEGILQPTTNGILVLNKKFVPYAYLLMKILEIVFNDYSQITHDFKIKLDASNH